jgi:hypothetical protein
MSVKKKNHLALNDALWMNKPGQRYQPRFHSAWRTCHMKALWMKNEYLEQMELCMYARE